VVHARSPPLMGLYCAHCFTDYKEFTLGVARLTEGTLAEKTSLLFDVFGAYL